MKKLFVFIIIPFFILGCAVNPVTKKREIMLFSDQEEIKMGKDGHEAVLIQFGRYDDPSLQRYVNQVGQKIARVSHRNNIPHHYMVLDSAILNAFALPGGYIYINRGLLAYLNNEAQLAGVLGHETGHVAARHGVKKYQKAIGAQLIMLGVAVATESKGLVLGTNLLLTAILQGYSRKDEYQADQLGTLYMYRAGYNPMEIARFFKILERMEKRTPNLLEQLFASHPPTPNRIEKSKAYARELIERETKDLTVGHNRYISHLEGLVFGPGARDGVIKGNIYKNRYFRYRVQMPKGWNLRRGQTAGSVLAQDTSKRYLSQVIPIELKKEFTPRQLASMVEKNSGLQRLDATQVTIDGKRAYLVDYRAQSEGGGWLGLRIAYLSRGKVGFIIANVSRWQEFFRIRRTFNKVIFGFRSLSPREAMKIPLRRLKVYMIRRGDTFPSISGKFYHTAKYANDIKQFNGMDELGVPPVGMLIKIKPII